MFTKKFYHLGLIWFISTVVIIIYYPSLFHTPRSDHLLYLAHVAGQNDWFSLAFSNYDYERTASYLPIKDTFLFRPLIYFIFGTEKWLFGYNFIYWQMMGVVLHLLVIRQLIWVLVDIKRSYAAYVLGLFFATLFINTEMVIWHHINSNMLIAFCQLVIIRIMIRFFRDKKLQAFDPLKLGVLFVTCSFTSEFGFISTILFLGFFYFFNKFHIKDDRTVKKHIACLAMIPMAYLAMYAANYLMNRSLETATHISLKGVSMLQVLENIFIALGWWVSAGLYPLMVEAWPTQRTSMLLINNLSVNLCGFLGIFILLTLLVLLARNRRQAANVNLNLQIASIGLLFVWVLLLSMFRFTRGIEKILYNNPYYAYYAWLYLIMFIYASLALNQKRDNGKYKFLQLLIILFLMFNASVGSYKIFNLNKDIAGKALGFRSLIVKVEELIKKDPLDQKISFEIRNDNFNSKVAWISFTKNTGEKPKYFELLYPQYYTEENPKYSLFISEDPEFVWKKND